MPLTIDDLLKEYFENFMKELGITNEDLRMMAEGMGIDTKKLFDKSGSLTASGFKLIFVGLLKWQHRKAASADLAVELGVELDQFAHGETWIPWLRFQEIDTMLGGRLTKDAMSSHMSLQDLYKKMGSRFFVPPTLDLRVLETPWIERVKIGMKSASFKVILFITTVLIAYVGTFCDSLRWVVFISFILLIMKTCRW